jgi:thiosulfate dehydrogenase
VVVAPLPDSAFPATPIGAAARRGRAILIATRDSLPGFVGNGLRCTSCHLDEGRRPFAMPWIGVHARYPQYRSRSARIQTVEDRINDCFERSLGGKPLPSGDDRLRAIESYFWFISSGAAVGGSTTGQGIDSVGVTRADTARGAQLFAASCARCHGADGAGSNLATPVWGEHSFSIGAGMGRYLTAAGFIRRNMPFDKPGTLTEQQALDVAAFVDTRPRRDFAGKERDWPKGGAPPDVPYKTPGAKTP